MKDALPGQAVTKQQQKMRKVNRVGRRRLGRWGGGGGWIRSGGSLEACVRACEIVLGPFLCSAYFYGAESHFCSIGM